MLCAENSIRDSAHHQLIKCIHSDGPTLAARLPLAALGATAIITISAALPRAEGHGAAAGSALSEPGEEDRPAHDTWRGIPRIPLLQSRLDIVEGVCLNDGGSRHDNVLALRFQVPGFSAPAVEAVFAFVDGVGEQPMDLTVPHLAPPRVLRPFSLR